MKRLFRLSAIIGVAVFGSIFNASAQEKSFQRSFNGQTVNLFLHAGNYRITVRTGGISVPGFDSSTRDVRSFTWEGNGTQDLAVNLKRGNIILR